MFRSTMGIYLRHTVIVTADTRIDAVASELNSLAIRTLQLAFERYRKMQPVPILNIANVVERSYPDEWASNKVAALEHAIRHAITYLTGSLGDITKQEAMLILFNLSGAPSYPALEPLDFDLVVGRGTRYSYVRDRLEAWGDNFRHNSRSVQNELIKPIRRALAEILSDPRFPDIPRPISVEVSSSPLQVSSTPAHIERYSRELPAESVELKRGDDS